jgi:alkylation response protein AidB-like acyl-CoA dehydrogenase
LKLDLTLDQEFTDLAESTRRLLASPVGQRAVVRDRYPAPEDRLALARALEELALGDLNVLDDFGSGIAAAQVARECGKAAAALPIASIVLARATGRDGLLSATDGRERTVLAGADLGVPLTGITVTGSLMAVEWEGNRDSRPHALAPAGPVRMHPTGETSDPWQWALHLVLSAFGGLGACEAAFHLTETYIRGRRQFGQTLASFQGPRNRIADMTVRLHGLRELAFWTLWRLYNKRDSAITDALVMRRYELLTIKEVFANAHQLHGAMGFCFDYPLAFLTLSQMVERIVPLTEARCLDMLTQLYQEIDLHYETISPAWPVVRRNSLSAVG